jgi:hypothetical protein
MCSSYWKFEPPKFRNFRERNWISGSDLGQFHYAMITEAQYSGPLSKKKLILWKVLKDYGFWNFFGIFKCSLEKFFSLCLRSILYTGNTRSGIKAHFGNFLYLMKACNWFNKWYLWNINPVFINKTL